MIRDAIREFYKFYYSSFDFKAWRDGISQEIYACLNSNIGLREDKIVGVLCDVMSAQRYRGLRIESKKTHSRSTSGVEFDYIGKKAITELADMVIISIVTFNREIILLKTAFVQNKKSTKSNKASSSWGIDPKQLFLLKNFPTFNGVSGIFFGKKGTFLNHSGTLGNYGLFSSDGDLIFLTAKNTSGNQSASGNISLESIKNAAIATMSSQNFYHGHYFCQRRCLECFDEYIHKRHFIPFSQHSYMPFFNNYSYAVDVHEIVKDLTYFNIGEPSSEFGDITDENLYNFTSELVKSAFGYSIGENYFNYNRGEANDVWDGGVNIILNHLELGKEY